MDDKGRLLIPARFRRKFLQQRGEAGADGSKKPALVLYAFRADDGSIELYEPEVWSEKEQKLLKLSDFNPDERLLTTMIYARLDQLELDRSGRIALSREMLDHAGIERDAVIFGVNSKMAVWNPERLARLLEDNAGSFPRLANRYVRGDGASGVS